MSAPLVVNTRDGACWTRRAVTAGGIALYAPEAVKTCPEFVMATLEDLAAHGIVGSADALPMPAGPEPQARTVLDRARAVLGARMAKDDLRLVLGNVVGFAAELEGRLRVAEDLRVRALGENDALRKQLGDAGRERDTLRERVAELEAERHTTNEALSDAAEQLRKDRDRIAELEAQRKALAVRLRKGQRWQEGRTPPLVSQDYVSQDELRAIFGIELIAPWDEDPCLPCGCPKRFGRHADGCPAVVTEAGEPS